MNNLRANYFFRLLGLSMLLMSSSCSWGEKGPPAFQIADRSLYASDLAIIAQAPRAQNDENYQEVQDLCASRFTELGYAVERHNYGGGVNVIGTLLGTVRSEEVVIVSAHYDTIVNSNGADDNASGVAAVLESARLLSIGKHERTLIVACWDQEEPALTGSYMYANRAKENKTQIQVAYIFDEIGYVNHQPNSQDFPTGFDVIYPIEAAKVRANQSRGDFVLLVFDNQASQWAHMIADASDQEDLSAIQLEVDLSGRVPTQLRNSDHQSFWSQGYPAIEITDTASNRNPYQHTDKDTISTLDIDFSIQVISAVVASVQTVLNP
jgi:Zn-dependent M28 family amino/carboxypeptidase